MGSPTDRRSKLIQLRYPRSVELKDKTVVKIRPMKESDEAALAEFFGRLPLPERRLFKDDVTDPEVISRWCKNINYESILPLLAFDGDRIVADVSLHREKRGWMSHVARIRISVDPDARGRGLATSLIKELVDIAPDYGVCILDAEVLAEQKGAMKVFEDQDFVCIASLPQHALDLNHKAHDLLVYSLTVVPPEKLAVDPHEDLSQVDIGGQG